VALCIDNGKIVAPERSGNPLVSASIMIDRGQIVGATKEGAANSEAIERLDATDGIVLPGLLNAHTHSPENLARGAVDRIAFEDWAAAVWPNLDQLSPKEIRIAVLLGCSEMLRTGTTAVVDHFRQTPMSLEAIEAAVAAYREAGMRCAVAVMLRDHIMPPWAPSAATVEETAAMCRAAIKRWHNPSRLQTIMLGPSAPHRCTDGLLDMVGDLSRKHGIYVQMHVDETRKQRQEAVEIYGHSTIRHLDGFGLLNNKVSLAHCVWIDDTDLDLLASSGTSVVHNPLSNLRLGSGIAPVPAMLDRGVTVALGADGAASNDSLNMFEVMKMASLVQGATGQTKRPTVPDILAMTAGKIGERFGMPGTGTLAEGSLADVVVFERNDARLYPLNDVCRQMVFGGGLRVRHVVIGGQVVVKDGVIQTFDEIAVFREAEQLAKRFATRAN
jgi:5-methylthioadenosine/S-adenosylhomocysteine deaminase